MSWRQNICKNISLLNIFSKIDRNPLRLYLQSCCFFLVWNFEWYIKKNIFGCIKHKRPFAFHWAKSASCSICFYLFWMVVDWIYTPTSGYTVFISVSPYTVQKEQEYVWRRRWFFTVVCICSGPRRTMRRNLWVNSLYNGQINYKGTKTNCHFYWYLIEYINWRHSQLCWYFWPSFVNYCPSNLLSGSPPPLHPFAKSSTVYYRQCVAGRVWGGCWVVLKTIFCRSFWPDSEPTKLIYHNKQKPTRGGINR